MFYTIKLQQKGCLFPKNCNRKGTLSETVLAHPRTKIGQLPPPGLLDLTLSYSMNVWVIFPLTGAEHSTGVSLCDPVNE